jgi:MoaA/NifB/PqqE/SkfB family radical SAM enzyme
MTFICCAVILPPPPPAQYAYYEGMCLNPFLNIQIHSDGSVVPCCPAFTSAGFVSSRRNTGAYTFGNIFDQPFHDIWYSKQAADFRRSVIDNSYRFCDLQLCNERITAHAGMSGKEFFAGRFDQNGMLKYPAYILSSLDNTCNVQCIFCRQHRYVMPKEKIARLNSMIDSYFVPMFKDAVRLGVSGGGECLASTFERNLLAAVCAKFPSIQVGFLTNGLLCDEKNVQQLGILDNLRDITVSLHAATAETYNQIIHHSNFERVMENVKYLADLKKRGKLQRVQISFVVTAINYREMKAFLALAIKLDIIASFWSMHGGPFSKNEIRELSVWQPQHPQYADFCYLLNDEIFASSHCQMNPEIAAARNKN